MLLKLSIIGLCGIAAYFVALRLGLNGSKGILRDPLTIALIAMTVTYGIVRATMGPLAGAMAWAEPIAEVQTEAELAALVADAGSEPILVDFYATWCMPCRAQAPAVNKVASEGYRVAVVNVDKAKDLARNYEVAAIPTIVVLREGKVIARGQGVHSAEGLRALVKE